MTNTMSCGCEIISDNLGAYKIEYCPKHKAADDMYKALKELGYRALELNHLVGEDDSRYNQWMAESDALEWAAVIAQQVLGKAGEKC